MPVIKSVALHPHPFDVRYKEGTVWIVLSRDYEVEEGSDKSPTWSFTAYQRKDGGVQLVKFGMDLTLEDVLLALRAFDATRLVLTKEDWEFLKPELEKPIVPTNGLISEITLTPHAGSAC